MEECSVKKLSEVVLNNTKMEGFNYSYGSARGVYYKFPLSWGTINLSLIYLQSDLPQLCIPLAFARPCKSRGADPARNGHLYCNENKFPPLGEG